jgi:Na+/melibiose symporter-like transporter
MSGLVIDASGWFFAAVAFAAPCTLLMILPYFAQPSGLKPREAKEGAHEPGMFEAFATAFRHRRFIAILCIFSGSQMSFTVVTAASTYIVEMLLGGSKGDTIYVLGPFLLTAIPFFIAVPWIERRFGWQRPLVVAALLLGVVYVGSAFLGQAIIGSKLMTAGILFALGGPMAAVLLGLEGVAVLACADQTEGQVTAIYFGVLNFVVKAMNGLAIALTGVLAAMATPDAWGDTAVRSMSVMAGGLLAVGVLGYFLLRPRDGASK